MSAGTLPWDRLGEASWAGISAIDRGSPKVGPQPDSIKDEEVLAVSLVEEPIRFIEFE